MRHVPRKSEVWILINCTGNQSRYIRSIPKNLRERIRKRRGRLNRHKMHFANIISTISIARAVWVGWVGNLGVELVLETEGCLACTDCDSSGDFNDVVIECLADVVKV